jgi:Tol biopolymer transport system component
MLWLRPLDSLHSGPVAGTEGAFAPFWSPDSGSIAFFADGSLKKVRIAGAFVESICAADSLPGGGTWSRDGTIVFAPGLSGGLYRVAAKGGTPQPVLRPDSARFEQAYLWPQFLPDGGHFVFFALTGRPDTTGVYAGTLGRPEHHLLFPSDTNAVYSALGGDSSGRGYLLFVRERHLTAQAFRAERLQVEGDPLTLPDNVGAVQSLSLAPVSVSNNAVLAYRSVGPVTRQMVWMHRSGAQLEVAGEPGEYGPPRISPDGLRAAVAKLEADGRTADIWILGAGGSATQFTLNHGAAAGSPVWSPDGSRLAFWSNHDGQNNLYQKPLSARPAAGPELLWKSSTPKYPTDWSRDGRYLFFNLSGQGTRSDVWGLKLGDRRAGPILDTIHEEGYAALSPDGRWLAYQSDASGRIEVYVQAFDGLTSGTKRSWQVSASGGGLPRWRDDGRELYYTTASGRIMSVGVHTSDAGLAFDPPAVLFQTRPIPKTWNLFDVSPDGQRFIINLPLEWSSSSPVTVITNWSEKLKR